MAIDKKNTNLVTICIDLSYDCAPREKCMKTFRKRQRHDTFRATERSTSRLFGRQKILAACCMSAAVSPMTASIAAGLSSARNTSAIGESSFSRSNLLHCICRKFMHTSRVPWRTENPAGVSKTMEAACPRSGTLMLRVKESVRHPLRRCAGGFCSRRGGA